MNTFEHELGGTTDTTRGASPAIWSDCPWRDIEDPRSKTQGIVFFDDFLDFPGIVGGGTGVVTQTSQVILGKYKVYNTGSGVVRRDSFPNSSGTMTAANQTGGVISMLCDTAGDQSVIGTEMAPFYLTTTQSGGLWFEARIGTTSIATAMTHIFVGLCNNSELTFGAAIPLADADATGTGVNLFGFTRLEDGLGVLNSSYTDEAASYTHVQTSAGAIAAETWVKVGFKIDFSKTTDFCKFYVNNVQCTTTLAKSTVLAFTNLDVSGLGPCFAQFADTSGTANYAYMDWWRVAQKY